MTGYRVESQIDFDGRVWRWTVTTRRDHHWPGRAYGRSRSERRARRQMDKARRRARRRMDDARRRAIARLEAETLRAATREVDVHTVGGDSP